jgi:hypothetical protein
MVLMKQTAFARKLIQVWGLDQRIAATMQRIVSLLVGVYDYDVWLL